MRRLKSETNAGQVDMQQESGRKERHIMLRRIITLTAITAAVTVSTFGAGMMKPAQRTEAAASQMILWSQPPNISFYVTGQAPDANGFLFSTACNPFLYWNVIGATRVQVVRIDGFTGTETILSSSASNVIWSDRPPIRNIPSPPGTYTFGHFGYDVWYEVRAWGPSYPWSMMPARQSIEDRCVVQ